MLGSSRYFPNFLSTAARVVSRSSAFCSQRVWKWRPESLRPDAPEVFQGHSQTGARSAGIINGVIPWVEHSGLILSPTPTPFFLHTGRNFPAGPQN